MKKFKDIPIRIRLPLLIGSATLFILIIVSIIQVRMVHSTARANAIRLTRMEALGSGNQLAERINSPGSVIRTFAGVMKQIATSTLVKSGNKRELLYQEMESLIKDEPYLKNLWCILEPNAIDGQDSLHINQLGCNSAGNFVPWLIEDHKGYRSTIMNQTYTYPPYIQAKKAGKEIITEPHPYKLNGEMLYFFSICIPILVDGEFLGVIGTDFNVRELAKELDKNGGRRGKLVTDKGTIALYHDEKKIGKPAESGNKEVLNKLLAGKAFDGVYEENGIGIHKTYIPIQLGIENPPWYYVIEIPEQEIYLESKRIARFLILGLLIGTFVIIMIGVIIIRPLLKNISRVTGVIHTLSSGDLDIKIEEDNSKDEIGQMQNELKQLVAGLHHTASFARDIGNGNFNTTYHPLSDKDILGNSLLETRKNLHIAENERKQHQAEEEQRNWSSTGVAKFAEILRQDNDSVESLAYNVISNLVKYMDANQGGIFLLNDEKNLIEMKACYAYNRKKIAEKQIMIGEGLIGTCFIEGAPIYLTEVPENYISITSGLGDNNPRAILITPLKINDEIFGVIELASFEPFEPYKLEFMDKLSESIAATISSVKINIRTNKLLEQTKIQAEEMANTEEELRQNMEEMQATQEESQRREKELRAVLEKNELIRQENEEKEYEAQQLYNSIYHLFSTVEFSSAGILEAINANVLSLLGGSESDFIGRTFAETYPGGEEEGQNMWEKLNNGELFTTISETNGHKIKYEFIPVFTKAGNLKKVVTLLIVE